ncbi:MAG: SCO family protein [Planctomycetota bacterium]
MKVISNVVMILIVGIVLGLIGRSLRSGDRVSGPGPDEIIYEPDVGPGEEPLLTSDQIRNDEVARPPEDEAWLSKFTLTERSGKSVSSEDLIGTPYVVSFFFSTCPSHCPMQSQKLKELQTQFPGENVRLLSISVDPEVDTPEVLREYAARFGADKEQWLFLTGELDYIRRVGAEIFQQPVNKGFHTDKLVLVDAKGKIEGFYTWPEPRQFKKLQRAIEGML